MSAKTNSRKRQRQGGASVAAYTIGGRTYPMVTVSQCLTCQSPVRWDIEKMILSGAPYIRIHEWAVGAAPDNKITLPSIQGHFERGHLPYEAEVVRRVLDRRAKERGEDLEQAVAPVVDGVTFAELVIQKSVQRMANGEISPTVTDGLNAARILEQFREYEEANSAEIYVQAFMVYHEVAQRVMTPEQFEHFGQELASNETLRELTARAERASGEVVEDEPEQSSFYAISAGSESEPVDAEVVEG